MIRFKFSLITIYNIFIIIILVAMKLEAQQCNFIANFTFEDVQLQSRYINFIDSNNIFRTEFISDTNIYWQSGPKGPKSLASIYPKYTNGIFYYSDSVITKSGKIFGIINFYTLNKNLKKPNSDYSTLALKGCLVKDSVYDVSIFMKPYKLNVLWDYLEIAFSVDNSIKCDTLLTGTNIALHDIIKDIKFNPISDTIIYFPKIWSDSFFHIHFKYVAHGGEQFIHLGNIFQRYPKKPQVFNIRNQKPYNINLIFYSLYIFDDISLIGPCRNSLNSEVASLSKKFLDSVLIFNFDIGADTLFVDVSKLGEYFSCYNSEKYKLVIVGSADLLGTNEDNYNLALRRAKFLKAVILRHSEYQIEIVSTGELPGDSEKDKTDNRRVKVVARLK